jgi:hypothetical protein
MPNISSDNVDETSNSLIPYFSYFHQSDAFDIILTSIPVNPTSHAKNVYKG